MPETALKIGTKAAFFFVVGVVFATLFIWALVQGILSHIGGSEYTLLYYFASWLAGVGAIALATQARTLFHYAQIIN